MKGLYLKNNEKIILHCIPKSDERIVVEERQLTREPSLFYSELKLK